MWRQFHIWHLMWQHFAYKWFDAARYECDLEYALHFWICQIKHADSFQINDILWYNTVNPNLSTFSMSNFYCFFTLFLFCQGWILGLQIFELSRPFRIVILLFQLFWNNFIKMAHGFLGNTNFQQVKKKQTK